MSDEIELIDDQGTAWYKYACSYTDPNGLNFAMELWATSDTDADQRASTVRESFRIEGRLCAVFDEDGTPLTESMVPENDSGVVH